MPESSPKLPGQSGNKPRSVLPAPASPKETDDSAFHHDLRNALAPALLCADILSGHADSEVCKNAETIIGSVEKALSLLKVRLSAR